MSWAEKKAMGGGLGEACQLHLNTLTFLEKRAGRIGNEGSEKRRFIRTRWEAARDRFRKYMTRCLDTATAPTVAIYCSDFLKIKVRLVSDWYQSECRRLAFTSVTLITRWVVRYTLKVLLHSLPPVWSFYLIVGSCNPTLQQKLIASSVDETNSESDQVIFLGRRLNNDDMTYFITSTWEIIAKDLFQFFLAWNIKFLFLLRYHIAKQFNVFSNFIADIISPHVVGVSLISSICAFYRARWENVTVSKL